MSEDKKSNSESQSYWEENAVIKNNILSGTYTLNHKSGKSKIWKFYDKIINDRGEEIARKVCCILCYTVLSHDPRTTSNLLRHKCYTGDVDTDAAKPVEKTVPLTMKHKIEAKERLLTKLKRIKNHKSITFHSMQENASLKCKVLSGSLKLRKRLSRSKIWNIFATIEDDEGNEIAKKVCCKTCYSVLNHDSKCTSNLVKHKCYIKASNTDPANSKRNAMKRTISSRIMDTENCEVLDEAMLLKELENSNSLRELEEVPLTNEVSGTTTCINENTYSDLQQEAVKIFSQWCIENFRPFGLAKDAGLRRFTEFIVSTTANYGTNIDIDNILPDPLTISQSIESQFIESFEKLRNEILLDCQNGYGLTTKLWTDNCWQQNYISLTIHYVKNCQLISKLLGLNVMDNDENINNVLGIKIQEILNNYNSTYKDPIIVIDGGNNMITALRKFNHISCINHILNNVIEKAINEVEELKELCSECLKLKKYFTDCNTNNVLSGIFKNSCLAQWNASYHLLEAIEKNWLELANILQQNNEIEKIKNIKRNYIEDVLRVLKPFEHASKLLEGEEYPTIHLVYAYINGLKDSCLADDSKNVDDEIIRQFKEILIDQLQTTVIANLSITHKIALFLFPPANKLMQFSELDKNLIKTKIISYLKPYVQNDIQKEIKKEPSSATSLPTSSSSSNTMISSYFKNFVTPPKNVNDCDEISSEICVYESLDIPYDDNFDILQWWHLRQTQFPLLYKLSCKILAAPASCASSERVFSIVKHLAENNTNIISNPKILNQLIFLNFNRHKNVDIEETSILWKKPKIEYEIIEQIF